MIAESDVSADPGARRLASRLLLQAAMFRKLSASARTKTVVHRLRVLTRRMRAACSVARRLGAAEGVRELARRLRKLGRALGGRRTIDVAADDYAALSGGAAHPAIEAARAEAEATLNRRIRAKHRESIALSIQTAVDALRVADFDAAALDALLRNRLSRLRESLGASSKGELHALRIEAKKLRYTLEVARVMRRPASKRIEAALRRLQRRLGRIHDLESLRHLIPKDDPIYPRAAAREAALRMGVRPLAAALRNGRVT